MKQSLPLLLFFIFSLSTYAQVQVFDVSDPVYNLDYNNAQIAIRAAYEDAKSYAQNNNNAPTKVYIPAGDYYLQLGSSTLIAMNLGPHNITIEGAGITQTKLIAEGFDSKLFAVTKTNNVTIKGMTLTRIGTPFFQGTVEQQINVNKIAVRRSTGFENPIVLDQNSGSQHTLWKITNSLSHPQSHPDMRAKKKIQYIEADASDPDVFIFKGNNWNGIFDVGDRVAMKAKYGEGMIKTSKADNITLEDLHIINTGASAIRITSGQKEFTVRNVHVKRGEAVNALGEVPYYTCGGGGFSFTHGNGNSIMENCSIEGTGDDPFSIHTYDSGDAANPPQLIVRNNTFKDVHGDLYLAELQHAEFYNNTIIRTNLQITNRSDSPSHHISIHNNNFVENVRQGTIRLSGLNNYLGDTSQWHHDIAIFENTFTHTGNATSILRLQIAKDITFRDNIIDGFTDVTLYNQGAADPALVHFDNLSNYTAALLSSLEGQSNCVINTNSNDFATHHTNSLQNINNTNICIDFCADATADNSNLCQAILPVELIHFSASDLNNGNLLQWVTAKEENNRGFYVEHATHALNWHNTAFVPAHASMSYSFQHDSPYKGLNYYRLKQVDNDGSFSYSPILSVWHKVTLDFNVSPNPNNGQFTIDVSCEQELNHPILVDIKNAHGQSVFTQQLSPKAKQHTIDATSLQSGIYYLNIRSSNYSNTKKIIIQ